LRSRPAGTEIKVKQDNCIKRGREDAPVSVRAVYRWRTVVYAEGNWNTTVRQNDNVNTGPWQDRRRNLYS